MAPHLLYNVNISREDPRSSPTTGTSTAGGGAQESVLPSPGAQLAREVEIKESESVLVCDSVINSVIFYKIK